MTIEEFIGKSRYSSAVKEGGFLYLMERWNSIVTQLPYDEDYDIFLYKNDISVRHIIDEIRNNCAIEPGDMEIIRRLDTLFIRKTIEVNRCVYGSVLNKIKYGKEEYWYY